MDRRVVALLGFVLFAAAAAPAFVAAQESPFPLPKFAEPAKVSQPAELSAPIVLVVDAPKDEVNAEIKISPNTGMPKFGQPQGQQGQRPFTIVDAALESGDYVDPRYVANSQHPDDLGLWEQTRLSYGEQIHRLVADYKNFYCTEIILYVGGAVGVAAPLANTHADQGIRNWYQSQAGQGRSRGWDNTADFFKGMGEYQYAIPAYLALSLGGHLFPDHAWLATAGNFGDRSLRALAVGAPAVGILQVGLGADRPYTQDSYWHPFQSSHAVSGHAFVGAVPFLTAAAMVESRPLKALLFLGSLGTAWSRIHTDDHYFSQALLGWAVAYLAVEAVNRTENERGDFRIVPFAAPNAVGMGVQIQY